MTTETRVWDYEAVEVGQEAGPFVREVTVESMAKHAGVVRNPNSDSTITMPTQIFSLAPKNRGGIAENNGMAVVTGHATPFAKCEGRWFAPIRLGDTITSVARVLEKYERRGNKFVTVRIEPTNQRGEKVAEIDHTSIFEFGSKPEKGKAASGAGARKPSEGLEPSRLEETHPKEAVATVIYDDIAAGDTVCPFTIHSALKTEVEGHDIDAKDAEKQSSAFNHEAGKFPWGALHGVGGITIMGFVDQMLERWAPTSTLYGGGRLLFKSINNFRPGDTNTYRGTVVTKRETDSVRLVDVDIIGVNQLGRLTGVGEATLVFDA